MTQLVFIKLKIHRFQPKIKQATSKEKSAAEQFRIKLLTVE